MHIPDGYIGPGTAAALWGAMVPAWVVAGRSVSRSLETRKAPLLALGGAFSFAVMLFNVPLPGGTTGHAIGAPLVAIALGPGAAVIAVTVALAIQALFFGDGGLLSLGANCFNIAFVAPLTAYAVYSALAAGSPSRARRTLAAAAGGYAGVNFGALATAAVLGIQPVLEPGHCPYGLATTIPAMVVPHLFVVGFVEAIATGGAVAWLSRGAPVENGAALDRLRLGERTSRAWAALGVLCLASPLGLIAAGEAFGEGGGSSFWRAPFSDYAVPGLGERSGYIVAALAGVAAIALVIFFSGWLFGRRERAS
jgi:cobalt/nickel transport system permease protein